MLRMLNVVYLATHGKTNGRVGRWVPHGARGDHDCRTLLNLYIWRLTRGLAIVALRLGLRPRNRIASKRD